MVALRTGPPTCSLPLGGTGSQDLQQGQPLPGPSHLRRHWKEGAPPTLAGMGAPQPLGRVGHWSCDLRELRSLANVAGSFQPEAAL